MTDQRKNDLAPSRQHRDTLARLDGLIARLEAALSTKEMNKPQGGARRDPDAKDRAIQGADQAQ